MPGWASFSMADEIIDFFYRGVAISIGANLYIRLLVSPSSRSGGGTETNYAGYARLILPRGTGVFAASDGDGQRTNSVFLSFPTANSLGNGILNSFDIVDTPSGAFAKLYNGGPILPPKALEVGKPPKFAPGALIISF